MALMKSREGKIVDLDSFNQGNPWENYAQKQYRKQSFVMLIKDKLALIAYTYMYKMGEGNEWGIVQNEHSQFLF